MGIFKLKIIKKYIINTNDALEKYNEKLNLNKSIEDLYSDSIKYIKDNSTHIELYSRMFDYSYLVLWNDILEGRDIEKKLKNLYKNNNIDKIEILSYARMLITIVNSNYKMDEIEHTEKLLNDNLPINERNQNAYEALIKSMIQTYAATLFYMFDIATANHKESFENIKVTHKELDDPMAIMNRCGSDARSGTMQVLSSLTTLSSVEIKHMSTRLHLAHSNLFKLKYEAILAKSLLEKLLNEEEFNVYSNTLNYPLLFNNSLIQEFKDNEKTIELIPKFYDLLRRRAYLIPYNGINITPSDMGLTFDIYERQYDNDNYIIVFTKLKEMESYIGYTIINLNKKFTLNTLSNVYDLLNFLYYFYKLDEKADEMYGIEFKTDPRIYFDYDILNFAIDKIIVKGTAKSYQDYTVEVPYYWRYRDNRNNLKVSKNDFLDSMEKGAKEIYVSAFKRKLPKGHKPSKEALDLSKIYCVVLDENETLVSPHIRTV